MTNGSTAHQHYELQIIDVETLHHSGQVSAEQRMAVQRQQIWLQS